MKGSTNATRGAADVVQNTSKIAVLDQDLQVATDSQPGIMSAADHATLSTTVTRMSTCEGDISSLKSGKQDAIAGGTGISIATDGKTINHSNSITARTSYLGSATQIPQIKYDAQGHITDTSYVTVYPPTSAGTSGQVWTSNGDGEGSWNTLNLSSVPNTLYDTNTRPGNFYAALKELNSGDFVRVRGYFSANGESTAYYQAGMVNIIGHIYHTTSSSTISGYGYAETPITKGIAVVFLGLMANSDKTEMVQTQIASTGVISQVLKSIVISPTYPAEIYTM